ncbi:Vps39_2 domain-containing protein [Pseudomonas sp. IT-P100]|uniref:hypothetical protein n=1 Tax=Pseudomonas sp. IT-P100 TaxID=3026452 RepID=UPI0039DF6820
MKELQCYDKEYHFNNARSLLDEGGARSLRYACLELRMLIEAHVYKRFLTEIDELPRSIINTWQPNKAVRLHSQFDKYADMDFQLTVGVETSEALEINYNNIKSSDLNKIYNSLGSYLHLPMPKSISNYTIEKEKIVSICDKLERLISGNLIVLKVNYMDFECKQCGSPVLYTDHYLESNQTITCQNEKCELTYEIVNRDNKAELSADYNRFSCNICEAIIPIPYKSIKDGHQFKCPGCENDFRFELVIRTETPSPKK